MIKEDFSMKKLIAGFCAALLLMTAANAVDLYVDLTKIETDTPPTIIDGRTLVPLRAIFEALGAEVEWDNVTRTAKGTRGDTVVSVQIDNKTAYVNGESRELDVPAQIINNRTMVPARFVSEALGCKVTWYQEKQTAAVADKLKDQQIYVTRTGKHYHFSGTCNGGTYYEATLAEAMGRGLTPCDKCVLTNALWEASAKTASESIKWDRTGEIPYYQDCPGVPDFGRIVGLPNIGSNATGPAYGYDFNLVQEEDMLYYFNLLSDLGYSVGVGDEIITCTKDGTHIDFWVFDTKLEVIITLPE